MPLFSRYFCEIQGRIPQLLVGATLAILTYMNGIAWHQSSTKLSFPTLPILVIGWMIAIAAIPNALHGKLPMGGMLSMIPNATARASSETVAALDDGSDSIDDDSSEADLAPLGDPSLKADPAADPMQGAQPLRVAHRSHVSSRHAHHRAKSHRKLVRAHH
jgi:hypothetical protein